MFLRQIFDANLAQYAYLIGCQKTGEALLIDPERDVDRYIRIAAQEDLRITAVAETHIHADFLSGSRELAETGVRVYLSAEGGADWSYRWPTAGAYDIAFLRNGDTFRVGRVSVHAMLTRGHTPEHLAFLIKDEGGGATEPMGLLSGDFIFVGDTGRPDLLESAAGVEGAMREGASDLYSSVERFLELPDYLQVWPGHGAGSACGKALGAVPETTVGYERRFSPAIAAARVGEEAFTRYVLEGQPEPPLYFGRMKRLNRDGVPLLTGLPTPRRIGGAELGRVRAERNVVLVDARRDRSAFMAGHLPGALFAPFDETFPTVTGTYVDPDAAIVLIIAEDEVEEAVRNLVRVGLDRAEAFAPPEAMSTPDVLGRSLDRIQEIDVEGLEARRADSSAMILDVRHASEFREGHVPGALNIAHTRLPDHLDALPTDRELAVYCRTGSRSAVASALLQREGFRPVYVNGMFEDWHKKFGTDEEDRES